MTAHDRGTARRGQVLRVIREATTPVGVAEIAEQVAAHPNTIRFHLDVLIDDGVVEQAMEASAGPGRPRVVYRARPVMALGGERRYRLLAEMLLSHVTNSTDDVENLAAELGQVWGSHAVDAAHETSKVTARDSVNRLIAMLEDMGFAPEPAAAGRKVPGVIRLRHCPFFELAEQRRDIVCPLHLGLMRGALAELRSPLTVTDLVPFAEPHACLAHLAPA